MPIHKYIQDNPFCIRVSWVVSAECSAKGTADEERAFRSVGLYSLFLSHQPSEKWKYVLNGSEIFKKLEKSAKKIFSSLRLF